MDTDTLQNNADTLKALAHPTRLQIVIELLKGTKCVNDIQDILLASQSNISQHLTVLRNARLVDFAQDGSQRCYYISRPKLVSTVIELLTEGEPAMRKSKDDLDREKHASGGACCVR
jgi:DNA-binding transcriptional ArsR family regulator